MAAPTPQSVHVERPLTNIALAYRNESYLGADFLFPQVPVQKISDLYWVFNKG